MSENQIPVQFHLKALENQIVELLQQNIGLKAAVLSLKETINVISKKDTENTNVTPENTDADPV